MTTTTPHKKYCEVALDDIRNRGTVLPVAEAAVRIAECRERGTPAYKSLHVFGQDFADHVATHGTVRGYQGASYAPYLAFDIDDPKSIDGATKTTQQFVGELIDGFGAPPEHIVVWFSGKKGYHVMLPAGLFGGWRESAKLHTRLRELAKRIAHGHDIDMAIYDQKRLLRAGGTRHDVSGYLKTHIPTEDFCGITVEEVLSRATTQQDTTILPPSAAKSVDALEAVWLDVQQSIAPTAPSKAAQGDPQRGYQTDLTEGAGRDNAFYWEARELRDYGVPAWKALNILRLWDSKLDTPLTETDGPEVLQAKVRSAYGGDAALDEDEGIVVHTGLEAVNEYHNTLRNPSASLPSGFPEIDKQHRELRAGEVCVMLGKTGSGKTALALNMLRHMAAVGHRVLFFSLEMTLARVMERQIAIELGIPASTIEGDYSAVREAIADIPWWDRYHICTQSAMTMAQIEETIQKTADRHGKVDAICIDYLGLIKSSNKGSSVSSYQAVSEIAASLKNVAKRTETLVMVLSQIGRGHGEDGDVPISLSSGRDSGVIEEGADLVLGIHRPERSSLDRTMAVQVLKSRKGMTHAAGDYALYPWDGPTFQICTDSLDPINLGSGSLYTPKPYPAAPVPAPTQDSVGQHIQEMFDGLEGGQ